MTKNLNYVTSISAVKTAVITAVITAMINVSVTSAFQREAANANTTNNTTNVTIDIFGSQYINELREYQQEHILAEKFKRLYISYQSMYNQTQQLEYFDSYVKMYNQFWRHYVAARQLKRKYEHSLSAYKSEMTRTKQNHSQLALKVCQLADEQQKMFKENLLLYMAQNRRVMAGRSGRDEERLEYKEQLLQKYKNNERMHRIYKQQCEHLIDELRAIRDAKQVDEETDELQQVWIRL